MATKKQLMAEIADLKEDIEDLENQINNPTITHNVSDYSRMTSPFDPWPTKKHDFLTIRGKVDAIIEYLGLKISVEQKSHNPAKVVIVKVKPTKRSKNVTKQS